MVQHLPSLVATLGPASWDLAPALRRAGATAFRINASHLDPRDLDRILGRLRAALPGVDVLVDLQGAKMRLGPLVARDVARGERVVFALDGVGGEPLPHPELFAQLQSGDTLTIDDGRLHLRVEGCGGSQFHATALNDGRLLPRKGVNVLQHPVMLEGLTAVDRQAVAIASQHGIDTFAFSFMLSGREADWLRSEAPGCRVVGKIERPEAAQDPGALARHVDTIWICRGDLGVQLGPPALARFVASLDPSTLGVPVLMAGQVLEHLTRHPDPTRSEVCHVFDLLARGYCGLVLSDETAIGDDPLNAVATAASLLRAFHNLNAAG